MARKTALLFAFLLSFRLVASAAEEPVETIRVRLSWGHESPVSIARDIDLLTSGITLSALLPWQLEADDQLTSAAVHSRAGVGDVDGVEFTITCPQREVREITGLHSIWQGLLAGSDSETRERLQSDPAYRRDGRLLTVRLNREGTQGFSVTVDQLLRNRAFWVPSLDVYLTAGPQQVANLSHFRPGELVPFETHRAQLEPLRGQRVLDHIHREAEASYAAFTGLWEDMGSPSYVNPHQPAPGHVVGLTWDSAIPKFGVGVNAAAWPDLGNPDKFRFAFDFADLSRDKSAWKSQRLVDGLPVIQTVFERNLRYEVEQFAYPLDGPPAERRGDIAMVLMQKVKVSTRDGAGARDTTPVITVTHMRKLPSIIMPPTTAVRQGPAFLVQDSVGLTLFCVEGDVTEVECDELREGPGGMKQMTAKIHLAPLEGGSREFVVKLPSPIVQVDQQQKLAALDYTRAREATIAFWSNWLARGAQFRAPEPVVNDLFRANLWHALRLPRRHGGSGDRVDIDLPYSNFAYGQNGTPWPVNQAVYVDYMLYDLRGYPEVSAEELAVMFRNCQEPSGRIKGYANWVVNTPSMLYVVAKHYMLTGDRAALDSLLASSLKAMDWCLAQIKEGERREGPTGGLVYGPLNDGTGEGLWAFNQAYIYAGLDLFGRVLREIGHPRATECLAGAQSIRRSIDTAFHAAAVRSPLVQLRDGTWIPYVPCEARTSGRLMSQWYPTDVDTGATHLIRLKAIPAEAPAEAGTTNEDLADWLLNDHEDNLYFKGWGMANEPVYNQQATAYLLRDDPEAAIRAFYSYMACAFSHGPLEPVEHRFGHGQYFGPPSTDGAWFELYRNMLVRECDDDTLFLAQATPRAWLADGRKIEVERAPTYFGDLSMTIESHANSGRLRADVQMPTRKTPKALVVRFRHPSRAPMRSVTVNGRTLERRSPTVKEGADQRRGPTVKEGYFDASKEWVRIENPREKKYSIEASY
jgi:hypothetical protein